MLETTNEKAYRTNHDEFGSSLWASVDRNEFGEISSITNYYRTDNGMLLVSTYERRSTKTSEKLVPMPSSLS